jgi:hypothetical protein
MYYVLYIDSDSVFVVVIQEINFNLSFFCTSILLIGIESIFIFGVTGDDVMHFDLREFFF